MIDSSATSAGHDSAGLRPGEAHAHAILDAALDAFITIDHNGHVLEFNRAAEQMFGCVRDEILGHELAERLVPPDQREAHRQALARWTADGPAEGAGSLLGRRIEVEAMRADGTVFPAELTISRVDLPGPPVFTACLRDISNQRAAEDQLRAAEFRYRMLVEQLPFISYVDVPGDPLAKPLYLSPQVQSILGYTPEKWASTPGLFEESIEPEDRNRALAARADAYERRAELRLEYRMRTAYGKTIWVEDRSVHVQPPDGGPAFRQGFAIDITERKAAEDALRRAEGRFRTLVERLPLAVYIDRLDAESSNVYTSPQIEPMLGYTPADWAANSGLFVELLHPDDREWVLAAHARVHATGDPLSIEYRLRARDGRYVWVHDEAHLIDDPHGGAVLQGYLLDVTARREAEEQLRYQAFHDPLTGLPNRALFIDRVEHALVLRSQHGGEVAVLFLDIDDLKAVNDNLGHLAGDNLLRLVGERLRDDVSATDTVSRLGGDEFAILIETAVGVPAAIETAERVLASLRAPFEVDGRQVFLTTSVGIALGDDVERLLRSADIAMYRAKAAGKAQFVVYAPWMDDDVVDRLELVADLRRAAIDEEFVLHYQPTVELTTGALLGIEALVRWQHPTRGLLAPAEFIDLAEETGRIIEIGRWVLTEASRTLARWRTELPGAQSLTVSVNVSTRQVRKTELLEDVKRALADSGLPPEALVLEITESVLAHRREEMRGVLEEIVDLGVQLALDDFGTGYSSLSLLQDLPVHMLKIDRSFVQALDSGPQRRAFVSAIVELATALDLAVVAEGVEDAAQARALRGLGCRYGQGFVFAAPLEPSAAAALIRAGFVTLPEAGPRFEAA